MAIPLGNIQELRELLVCPLSYERFQDPVTEEGGTCGHTFEAVWIQQWVADHQTCPLSRNPLTLNQLLPNPNIKMACDLLDPARVEPLTAEDMEIIHSAAEDFVKRENLPVSQHTHDSLLAKISKKVSEAVADCAGKTKDFYSC